MSKKRVAYYHDPDVGAFTYGLGHPMKPQRMRITHELVSAYGMLKHMHVLRAKRASAEEMTRFHTDEYIHFLSRVIPETAEELTFHGTRFLVGDDNPPFEGVFDFCALSAGGSIEAGQRLASGASDIAINWAGGLHHAKKREASGFCYINDIVLGILELLRVFPRVLYIDIDCHHGDGVEEAFYTTDRVMTCSFHKFGEYFPGTGTQDDRGRGVGKGYSVNVPLKDGLTDDAFKSVFEPVIAKIMEVFQPSAIVLQCGADSLAGDKLGCFNITMQGHANSVRFVRDLNVPMMILGGGGYTVKNVARTWAYETACALGVEGSIDPNLPWNEYFEWFGPRYRLEVVANNMEDLNVKDKSLDKVRETTLRHLSELMPAPSVGLQDVPSESLGDHLGFRKESKKVDGMDERLAQHMRFVYGLQDSPTASPSSHSSPSPSSSSTPSSSDVDSDSDYSYSNSNSNSYAHSQSSSRMVNRSSRRQRGRNAKKRMSITTNKMFEIPSGGEVSGVGTTAMATATRGTKRRFFFSQNENVQWDEKLKRMVTIGELARGGGDIDGTAFVNGLGNGKSQAQGGAGGSGSGSGNGNGVGRRNGNGNGAESVNGGAGKDETGDEEYMNVEDEDGD